MKYPNPKSYDKVFVLKKDKTLKYDYFMDKEHPLADKKGRVYYHRHVYSLKINKWVDASYHVHHKDEIRDNNHPDNLEIKSPSMHIRTHLKERGYTLKKYIKCKNCESFFWSISGTVFCSVKCMGLKHRLFEISKEELERLVWDNPVTKIAEGFNVSDVAIGKRCKVLGIKKPPRGYWAKVYANKK